MKSNYGSMKLRKLSRFTKHFNKGAKPITDIKKIISNM